MNKKIVTLALATVMTFAMSITSFAAGSAKAPAYTSTTAMAYEVDYSVVVKTKTEGVKADSIVMTAEASSTKNVAIEKAVASKSVEGKKVEVVKTVGVELTGTVPADGKVKVSVDGLGVKKGDTVLVNHFTNGAWQEESASVVGDDEIEINGLKSFSPFLISKVTVTETTAPAQAAASAASAAPAAQAAPAAAPTSPKTGFSLEVLFAAIADLF